MKTSAYSSPPVFIAFLQCEKRLYLIVLVLLYKLRYRMLFCLLTVSIFAKLIRVNAMCTCTAMTTPDVACSTLLAIDPQVVHLMLFRVERFFRSSLSIYARHTFLLKDRHHPATHQILGKTSSLQFFPLSIF